MFKSLICIALERACGFEKDLFANAILPPNNGVSWGTHNLHISIYFIGVNAAASYDLQGYDKHLSIQNARNSEVTQGAFEGPT